MEEKILQKSITENAMAFYNSSKTDPNHRYKSWEHCISVFKNREITQANLDKLSLHLGFFLASWGMFRGKAALLQKDYKVYNGVISIILNKKYCSLYTQTIESDTLFNNEKIELILNLKKDIINYFETLEYNYFTPSETLITKIILGTLGCVPAYDNNFKKGISKNIIQVFSENSLKQLNLFIKKNITEIRAIQEEINSDTNTVYYPIMKIIDMHFWQIGYELNEIEEASKIKTTKK